MIKLETIQQLRDWRKSLKSFEKVLFVPTMGSLHEGHLSLIKKAQERKGKVCVSIYVNPLQFDNKEDLKKYPVSLQQDIQILKEKQVDAVFFPESSEMGNQNFSTGVEVKMRPILCHKFRPNHFKGVATIVAKLLLLVQPDSLFLGEKDYQQCMVLRKMIEDLGFPVKVVVCKTIREKSGLAMSSRNNLLSVEGKKKASYIYQTLLELSMDMKKELTKEKIEERVYKSLESYGLIIEYVVCVCATSLEEPQPHTKSLFVGVAVLCEQVRLIDHIILKNT